MPQSLVFASDEICQLVQERLQREGSGRLHEFLNWAEGRQGKRGERVLREVSVTNPGACSIRATTEVTQLERAEGSKVS